MCNGHILTQATHELLLVAVHGVDDTTRTEEQTSLEHGMGKEMEHSGHVTQSALIRISLGHGYRCGTFIGHANTQGHEHEADLRDG